MRKSRATCGKLYSDIQANLPREERFDRERYTFARKLLLPLTGSGTSVIDVGCGAAEFARLLRDEGYSVTCVDLNQSSVDYATQLGFEAFCLDLNQLLPFEDDSFDGAVILDVIEHVVNAEQLLDELARVIRRNGFLVLSTPNIAFYKYRLQSLWGYPPPNEGTHFRFLTKKLLDDTLQASGFVVVKRNSCIYAHGLNKFRKVFLRKQPVWVRVPEPLESLIAPCFVVLCRNQKKW